MWFNPLETQIFSCCHFIISLMFKFFVLVNSPYGVTPSCTTIPCISRISYHIKFLLCAFFISFSFAKISFICYNKTLKHWNNKMHWKIINTFIFEMSKEDWWFPTIRRAHKAQNNPRLSQIDHYKTKSAIFNQKKRAQSIQVARVDVGHEKVFTSDQTTFEFLRVRVSGNQTVLNILNWSFTTLHASIITYSMDHVQHSFTIQSPIFIGTHLLKFPKPNFYWHPSFKISKAQLSLTPCHLNIQSTLIIGTNHLTLFSLVNLLNIMSI